eukprot:scpid56863/ scgid19500/ 
MRAPLVVSGALVNRRQWQFLETVSAVQLFASCIPRRLQIDSISEALTPLHHLIILHAGFPAQLFQIFTDPGRRTDITQSSGERTEFFQINYIVSPEFMNDATIIFVV